MRRLCQQASISHISDSDLEKNKTEQDDSNKIEKVKHNSVKEYLVDYTANSNLHGLKYIGEKERTTLEKLFWIFVFVFCVFLCAILIWKVWIKWNMNPVIVSFADNPTPVWQIPFPAVTVCPETKARQSKFNFTKYYHLYRNNETYFNLTEEERNLYEDVSTVCEHDLAPSEGRKFSNGFDTVTNIKEVSPNLTKVFFACKWKDIPQQHCSDIFSPILTEEGQCYTFNTLGADDLFRMENLHDEYPYLENEEKSESWTLDEGYKPNTPIETYPHRGSFQGYGAKSGLSIFLTANLYDLDYICKFSMQGFKIFLHNAAEFPTLSQQYYRSLLDQEIVLAVKTKLTTTSDGLRPYDPLRRKCYFPNERYLHYFKVYTQANCKIECLSNFTYTRCGCVHVGTPHASNMLTCNAGSMQCIENAKKELVTIAIESKLDNQDSDNFDSIAREVFAQCNCLPSCISIEYGAETSQANYDWSSIYRAFGYNKMDYFKNVTFSRFVIFLNEPEIITLRRSELYGLTDFLANCGGLLGLFMGFSILSLVEILYFLSLRIYCVFKKRS